MIFTREVCAGEKINFGITDVVVFETNEARTAEDSEDKAAVHPCGKAPPLS
jgi:hypothetical protein